MIGNLDLLYSCFNQYLFQTAKENLQSIRYYYQTNPATSGNTLVEGLLDAIRDYDLENLGEPLFQSILLKSGKNQAEYNQIMGDIMKYKMFTKDQIEPARKLIKNIHAGILLSKAGSKFKDDPCEYINYIKGLNFKTSEDGIEISSTNFGNLDINTIMAEDMKGGPISRADFINNSFQPECCYPNRGLICISMMPGGGKTLFSMAEALNFCLQGKKVLYTCLGDMVPSDFIVRLGAIYYGIPFAEAKANLPNIYKSLKQILGDRLEIMTLPADYITVDDYIEYVKAHPEFDIMFIDYDENFKSGVASGASMYVEYGQIYSRLSELTVNERKLVFVLSQPNKAAWNMDPMDVISMDLLSSSSRKGQVVDALITRTKVGKNGLGVFYIAKNRRGEEGATDYSIRLGNGRFKSIPKGIYQQLIQIEEKRDFSEAEIDVMIQQYNQTRNNINGKIQAATQQQQQRPVKNPF